MSAAVREYAPAKINLFLEVVGKRIDGYHHLQSLMVFCNVGEYVEIAPAVSDQFTIAGPMAQGLSASDDNLVKRAAKAFLEAVGLTQPMAVHLHKEMPVSSGIGGGSADAAATLRALDTLFENPLSRSQLLDICTQLGADVPACFLSVPVCLDGVGSEVVQADFTIDFPYTVLVNPSIGVSTPAVFAALNAGQVPTSLPILGTHWSVAACAARRNDLSAPAIAICPQVQACLDALEEIPEAAFARMSGSGATCFAVVKTADDANRAVQSLRVAHPGWWVASGALQ